MKSVETCGALMRLDYGAIGKKSYGCLKPYAHNDSHIDIVDGRKIYEWEDDVDCGCCDHAEESDVCYIYEELTADQAKEKLREYWSEEELKQVLDKYNEYTTRGNNFITNNKNKTHESERV